MARARVPKRTSAQKAYAKEKERAYQALFADRRFQRLEALKEASFRASRSAELSWLKLKRETDRVRYERANRRVTRVIQMLDRYIDAFLAKRRVGFQFEPKDDPYARDRRPLRRRRR